MESQFNGFLGRWCKVGSVGGSRALGLALEVCLLPLSFLVSTFTCQKLTFSASSMILLPRCSASSQALSDRESSLQTKARTRLPPFRLFFSGIFHSDGVIQVEKEVGSRNRAGVPVSALTDRKPKRQQGCCRN